MKARSILSGAALVLATAVVTSQVVSQEAKQPPPMSPEEQAFMQKWEAYAKPGEHHKILEAKVGSWENIVKMWMDPNAPPSESKGTTELEMALDGRFLVCHSHGETPFGPFEGMGCTGYDNLKNKYVFVWVDNMGTGVMHGEGAYDAAKKAFTYISEGPDVEAGKYVTTRTVERWIDDDHWVMENYAPGKDGKEFKCMEITYSRTK